MSKPLIFVMQLAALYFIVTGFAAYQIDGEGIDSILIGIALVIVSGIAIRKRLSNDKKD